LLDIKPVLTMRDGTLDMLERVRTEKKAWSRVIELASEAAGGREAEKMAIVHADAPAKARRFEQLLRSRMPCPGEIIFAPLTPGLSVVSGPGLIGLVLVAQT
jgi:fatty acid-binding protein DegV